MGAWKAYIDNLMNDGDCQDCAIVGYLPGCKAVWASCEGGIFTNITVQEIDSLVGGDRHSFFINGLTLGAKKCSVIRDSLFIDSNWTMDIRTKSTGGEPTFNISVGMSNKALVVVMGKDGVHGGVLNNKAFVLAQYLKGCGL